MDKIRIAKSYIDNVSHFEDCELGTYRQLGVVKKTLSDIEVAIKGALAALTQNKTFPADIEAAKKFLQDVL